MNKNKKIAIIEKAGKNANFNQREKIAVVDGELGIFRVMEKNQPEKNQQNYAHDNIENKIVHNNLFLLSRGDQNNQADGNGQKSAEDVDVNHSIVNHNYSLDNNKPNDQKISARVKPESIIDQLNFSEKSGSIKTEAKNTWPISRQISDKVSNLNKVNFINSNNYSNSNNGLSNF